MPHVLKRLEYVNSFKTGLKNELLGHDFRANLAAFLIADRLSTLKQVGRIAVVADWRIAELGSHQLLALRGKCIAGWERGGLSTQPA